MKKILSISIFISVILVLIIRFFAPELDIYPHLVDKGPAWYYWKLPVPTFWGNFTAITGFILHMLTVIIFILYDKKHTITPKFTKFFLLSNLFFVILHILQTHLFYDGLAQIFPVWSSQYSVILMLSITLILLMPRRGFILGHYRNIPVAVYNHFKKLHGIYISWALVYTFWFHPTEGDVAILLGFFYMFLLFIHMSMIKTKVHYNMRWVTLLEFFVVIHGVAIAIMNAQAIWPMFLFGFLFMFIFTYLYGLGFNKILRVIIRVIYVISILVVYYYRGYHKIYEILFIPITLYGISLFMLLLAYGFNSFKKN